ncbi:MAG TPA: MBL fold metallo-hydrolase [Vicinamibacterales bacterium]|nr:MBL fold metallo-hydrolase [Vicinamibacterales bacterium]
MQTLASGISYIDVLFRGMPRIIASVVLHGPGGAAIIDPGPTSTLPTLRAELEQAGLSMGDVRALLLTHIHLDHAGAAGTLVHEHPHMRVYVHDKGAPHMVDPSKLLASATRLYGDAMDRLWGEVRAVPQAAISVLNGGGRISAGGRDFDVAYTPGHASHHVSYFNADSGIAFVGDTAGVRVIEGGFNVPPTPPPDIDLDLWRDSLARINAWRPDTLFITHFGPHRPVATHISELQDNIHLVSGLAKQSLALDGSDEDRERWFTDQVRNELRRRVGEDEARAYEVAGRFDLNWRGLARYWRKRPA